MSIAKFDLYNAEWLDLVFDHRNKEYGAYDLRKNYGRTMSKAIGLSSIAVAVLVVASFVFRVKPQEVVKMIPVDITPTLVKPPVEAKPKPAEPAAKPAAPVKPAAPIQTTAFTTPHIVPTAPPVDPPVIKEITGAVGPETIKGPAGGENAAAKTEPGPGGNGTTPANNGIVDANDPGLLEVMPEPVGGAAAWAKFLQKNLRFPGMAQDAGVSGRVIMSFIIEKDGSLSNIKVERGAGYGFDEEALRVLKLAKAWKPGIQNGQPVRVRYNIPMSFQLSEQ